jgi:hypothetical protein
MYVIREVVTCKPGKVSQMVDKFKALSTAMRDMGHEPFRLMTDVSGDPFWTVVAEATVGSVDEFFAIERKLRESEAVRQAMAGYHDLVTSGRREIYHVEG